MDFSGFSRQYFNNWVGDESQGHSIGNAVGKWHADQDQKLAGKAIQPRQTDTGQSEQNHEKGQPGRLSR